MHIKCMYDLFVVNRIDLDEVLQLLGSQNTIVLFL